jgi:hypothetical protein
LYEIERKTEDQEREEKNKYLIHLRMNSCSLSWVSYCSSTSDFQLNGEAAVRCFDKFFAIFRFFILFESSSMNALRLL